MDGDKTAFTVVAILSFTSPLLSYGDALEGRLDELEEGKAGRPAPHRFGQLFGQGTATSNCWRFERTNGSDVEAIAELA